MELTVADLRKITRQAYEDRIDRRDKLVLECVREVGFQMREEAEKGNSIVLLTASSFPRLCISNWTEVAAQLRRYYDHRGFVCGVGHDLSLSINWTEK